MVAYVAALVACTQDPERQRLGQDLPRPPGTDPSPADPEPDCVPAARVVINELSPSNVAALLDSHGESVDWIELANADAVPVDLAGWTLSDDGDQPAKWTFPSLTLAPGALQLVYASDDQGGAWVAAWDTRVDQGHEWRYLEVTAPPDPDWAQPGFDDGAWPSAPSGFGDGDGDDATAVTASTVYVRTPVALTSDELADLVALQLHVDYDDAFVAYLNGVEVARAGVGAAGTPPAWDEPASASHEALLYQGLPPDAFALDPALLVEGENVLAVEVHDALDSSDLTLVPFLSLGFGTPREATPSPSLGLRTGELYASFSLRADGERLRLYDPSGCEADDVEPVALRADESHGRQPDGTGPLGYFLEPTPGAPNTTEWRAAFAPTPVFDPPPGHHPGGADVRAIAPGAVVRVAVGGAVPTEDDPPAVDPVPARDGDAVVLRARAWADGLWPSRVATATYLLAEPGALPIVSLAMEPDDLWDDEVGIYTFGPPDHETVPPYYGANFWEDWERPVHLEEWEPDGALGFSVDAGISIFGNKSREHGQKSLLVELGPRYGGGSIEHELFPGLGITSFERVLLRNAGQDWHGCSQPGCSGAHLRDGLMQRFTDGVDVDALAYRPAEVYLNGEYWGIYQLYERPDEEYVRAHHGLEDIDLLEQSGGAPIEGDAAHWDATMEWLRTHDLSDPVNYDHVRTLIDVDELQAYLAFEVFYANTDWPGNNIKYWRPRTPDGRWRWILYDTDFGLGAWGRSPAHDTLAFALEPAGPGWPNPPWATELFRLLVTSPEFTESFVNRYADWLNTSLDPAVTLAVLDDAVDELAPQMARHVERWGTYEDATVSRSMEPGAWEAETDAIAEWLAERPQHARDHVSAAFGLAGTWTLTLEADPPGAGTFALAAVEVEAPFEGVYFRGVPVTVTAVAAPGHTFAGWTDPSLGGDASVTVDPAGPLTLVARFQ